jgi:PTH1 family peptidyl-tRNA hydrolase
MPEIKCIVGLGNPGKKYETTRHNIGFQAVDFMAVAGGLHWKRWDEVAEVAGGSGGAVLFVKPQTYMNNSGIAVRSICSYYRFSPEEILVIVDDFALPFGTIRPRRSGSPGGHNGLASITDHLGTPSFPRLRLGVGPLPPHTDAADFVLAPFPPADRAGISRMLEEAAVFISRVQAEGWDKAVSKIPGKKTDE